jgi:hypothetical protein
MVGDGDGTLFMGRTTNNRHIIYRRHSFIDLIDAKKRISLGRRR